MVSLELSFAAALSCLPPLNPRTRRFKHPAHLGHFLPLAVAHPETRHRRLGPKHLPLRRAGPA